MNRRHAATTAQILEKVKGNVAPLPSQAAYMKQLAGLLAMHMNRNLLMDEGYAPDDFSVPSAIVVAPTGQGKTFLLRKMVGVLDLNLITVDCGTLVGESYKGVSLSQRIAGAFVGLEEIIRARICPRSKIGFDAGTAVNKTDAECMQMVTADDLEKFGLMRELLDHIGTILILPPLGLEDYKLLLNTGSGSAG